MKVEQKFYTKLENLSFHQIFNQLELCTSNEVYENWNNFGIL